LAGDWAPPHAEAQAGGQMSARRPFVGGGHAGASYRDSGKRNQSGLYAAIMGAVTGAAVGLIAVLTVTQGWVPFGGLIGAAPVTTTTPSGAANPPQPTTPAAPTPLPLDAAAPRLSWPTYMGASDRTGYNAAETLLTPATVPHLKLHWKLHARGSIFAQPVVANGLVYWGSWDGYEHATSIATGRDIWATYLGQTANIPCEGVVVGVSSTATVAFAPVHGRRTLLVFVGGGDAAFYALNAQTGAVVWRTSLGAPPTTYLWSSPAYYAGSIYTGVASLGDCPLVQGQVVKLNSATGAVERVFGVVPRGCVGGTVWGSVAIDPTTGLLYVGTGNQGACGVYEAYADAVIALRADDLALVGAWQATAALQFGDSDFGSTPTIYTAQVNGKPRRMVGIANKDGVYYAFDAAHVGSGPVWSARVSNVAICPSCGDGGWVPGAWDGKALYEPGGKTTINGAFCPGGLRAFNPANGAVLWAACLPGPAFGALTLGPGFLVLQAGPAELVIGTQGATAGRILFRFQDAHAPAPWFYGAASIADGVLYVGDANGDLYALGL
jgi:outer membrane protein assembly factor BamB